MGVDDPGQVRIALADYPCAQFGQAAPWEMQSRIHHGDCTAQ
jgi:hypothetical protein